MLKLFRRTFLWILVVPLICIFLGAASNQSVILANHGKFPVEINPVQENQFDDEKPQILNDGTAMLDDIHCLAGTGSCTRLVYLADVLNLRDKIESVGDLSLDLGEWGLTWAPWIWGIVVVGKLKDIE